MVSGEGKKKHPKIITYCTLTDYDAYTQNKRARNKKTIPRPQNGELPFGLSQQPLGMPG